MFKFLKVLKVKSKIYNGLHDKDKGNFEEALKSFDEVLEIMPDCKHALYFKGKVYEEMKKYDNALNCFDKVITTDPFYIGAWIGKGKVFISLKKYNYAIKCFNRGLESNKDNADLLLYKTYAYLEKGDYESALKFANYGLKTNPERARFLLYKADSYNAMGDFNRALDCYKKVTEIYPKYKLGWYRLTLEYEKMNKLEEAVDYLEKSIELDKSGDYTIQHVLFFKDLGKYEEALKLINRKLRVEQNPALFYLKWKLLEKLQKGNKAVKYYKKAIKGYEIAIEKYVDDEDADDWKKRCEESKNRIKILQKR